MIHEKLYERSGLAIVTDSIILELLARVQKCEREIKLLSEEINLLKSNKNVNEFDVSNNNEEQPTFETLEKDITRSEARELVISKLREILPNKVIRAGNRREGSGIVIVDSKGTKRKYKFYHSNNRKYGDSAKNIVSWSGVMKNDLDNIYDGYIFSIWANKLYVLLFTHRQLANIITTTNRVCDTNNKYHFSFTIIPPNKVFETRTPNFLDVSYSLNNFEIIKKREDKEKDV